MKLYIKAIFVSFLVLFSTSRAHAAVKRSHPIDTVALSCRGVMECFPKITDGIEARLDFYKSKGITHYFYCPSDDKYCNRWGWKFLYNDSDRHSIKNLNTLCLGMGMEFVWTVNPGLRYNWKQDDYKFLLDKLVMMYYNGIRSFAIDFTDNPGPHAVVRDSLLKHLPVDKKKRVNLYVIDDIPEVIYPSEGSPAAESLMRGYHFTPASIAEARRSGAVVCNLSASDEFAKLAVAAVADFGKNPEMYSPDQSIADAVKILHGDVREAFLTFLRNTGGVEESSGVEVFSLEEWTKDKAEALGEEFDRIEKVPSVIGSNADSEIIEVLSPWLAEFGRLGSRGKLVLECMKHYTEGNIGAFWMAYLKTLMSPEEIASYKKYPVGADKLHPFCMDALLRMKQGFTRMLSGKTELYNLASTLYDRANNALDSDFETCVPSGGHMEFAIPASANTCHLLTGPIPEGRRLLFRQLATDGSLVAEFVVRSPFTTFDIKDGAVKVDVLGEIEIYETIFVDLHGQKTNIIWEK